MGTDNKKVDTSSLTGKTLMIYFSAHWCPPCRNFTPKLAEFYKENAERLNFEIVFASSDRDEAQFNEYFGEMPWLAVPFSDRKRKNELSKEYKVNGIPSLVVVSPVDGSLITDDGRSCIDEDPKGANFPWTPPTLAAVLTQDQKLTGKSGDVAYNTLNDKYLMLYFSAHWCPPCRGFTPTLVNTYNELIKARSDVELVFVSSDRDEESFKEYYGEMPWLALPFADRDLKGKLSKIFGVNGIPSLVILDKVDGEGNRATINGSARSAVDDVSDFPWYPKKYGNLSVTHEAAGSDIGADNALIVFAEMEDDGEQAEIKDLIEKMANERDESKEKVLYFYASEDKGVAKRVRELIKEEKIGDKPLIVKLTIPDGDSYVVCDKDFDLTAENLSDWYDNPTGRKGTFS